MHPLPLSYVISEQYLNQFGTSKSFEMNNGPSLFLTVNIAFETQKARNDQKLVNKIDET